jgi:hypothetical protein
VILRLQESFFLIAGSSPEDIRAIGFQYKRTMLGISPQSITRFCNWITFVVSVIGLLDLLFIAPWQCGQIPAWSGGRYSCELDTGWYFFLVVFVIFTGFSGYRVYRMRRNEVGK